MSISQDTRLGDLLVRMSSEGSFTESNGSFRQLITARSSSLKPGSLLTPEEQASLALHRVDSKATLPRVGSKQAIQEMEIPDSDTKLDSLLDHIQKVACTEERREASSTADHSVEHEEMTRVEEDVEDEEEEQAKEEEELSRKSSRWSIRKSLSAKSLKKSLSFKLSVKPPAALGALNPPELTAEEIALESLLSIVGERSALSEQLVMDDASGMYAQLLFFSTLSEALKERDVKARKAKKQAVVRIFFEDPNSLEMLELPSSISERVLQGGGSRGLLAAQKHVAGVILQHPVVIARLKEHENSKQ